MMNHQALIKQLAGADKLWHLEQTFLAKGLSTEEMELLSKHTSDRIYDPGEVIFQQGQEADCLYFLNRGSVRLAVKSLEGREKTVAILKGGDLFGLESTGYSESYQVYAISHEETWASVLTRQKFLELAHQQPALCFNLMHVLVQRLADAHNDIRALCFMDIQQRLVAVLLKLSQTHGRRIAGQDEMTKLTVRISHDYLARLTGSNRPYLSNIMSHFKKQGWVKYDGNRLLVNTGALERIAS